MRTRFYQVVALAAVLTAGATASSPVLSADMLPSGPPPLYVEGPPPSTQLFAGWWLGATLGGGTSTIDFSDVSDNIAGSGILGGGIGGWNWQNGPVVIGLEGDVVAADINGGRHFNAGANNVSPSIDTMADLRLRAGVAVTPNCCYLLPLAAPGPMPTYPSRVQVVPRGTARFSAGASAAALRWRGAGIGAPASTTNSRILIQIRCRILAAT